MQRSSLHLLYFMLTKKEKRALFYLGTMMVALAGMELFGVGSVFFYIDIIANQSRIIENPVFAKLFTWFGSPDIRTFLIILGMAVFAIMLLRGLFAVANLYAQNHFTARLRHRLSMEIMGRYLAMPYEEALSVNTAVLSKHLLVEVSNVVASLSQVLLLVTELSVAFALSAMIVWLDPLLMLMVVGVLGVVVGAIVYATRKRISVIGRESEAANALMFKSAAQALQGFKEIKTYGVEHYFAHQFEMPLVQSVSLGMRYEIIAGVPGMIINLLAFGSVLLVLLYLLFTRGTLISALPIIAAIGVALQRLLPSVYKMYSALGLIRKYEPGIGIIYKHLTGMCPLVSVLPMTTTPPPSLQLTHSLHLQDVRYRYPGAIRDVLQGISIKIPRGTVLGIVGESGVGKTTLVDIILGLLIPTGGKIICDDTVLEKENLSAFRQLVGYVPQQTFLLDDTLRANVAFGIPETHINERQVREVMQLAQLDTLLSQLPQGLDTIIGERGAKLSGGQRQRIGIARALYRNPSIIVLDEATNSLDLETEADFFESLKQILGQKTFIIVAHRVSAFILCSTIVMLKEGAVCGMGSLADLAVSSPEFRALYAFREK